MAAPNNRFVGFIAKGGPWAWRLWIVLVMPIFLIAIPLVLLFDFLSHCVTEGVPWAYHTLIHDATDLWDRHIKRVARMIWTGVPPWESE